MAELDVGMAPLTAYEKLQSERAHMKPTQVHEMMLLATGSQELARREWERQVEYLLSRDK